MRRSSAWDDLNRRIEACTACERLVTHCRKVAQEKRAAYRDWNYWGKPVPNMGSPRGGLLNVPLLIVGLAPGAHGSNRTGRMFTGDDSGNWLFRSMHRAGFASQPTATERNDGLRLIDCAITAVGHCAPPDNKPERGEIENCRPFLSETIGASGARVYMALGGIAWRDMFREFRVRGWHAGALPAFGHGRVVALSRPPRQIFDKRQNFDEQRGHETWALACYHPSRQNTNTGRLTEAMLDDAFASARRLVECHG